jgi:hypothetical protein
MGIFKRNGEWTIDYYFGGRRFREKVGSKGEAQKALAVRKAQIVQGRFELRPQMSIPTFKQFAKRYTEFARANKRGFHNEQYRIKQLGRFFGSRKLSDLTNWDGEKFKVQMSSSRKPATLNRLLGNLKHMLASSEVGHSDEESIHRSKAVARANIP